MVYGLDVRQGIQGQPWYLKSADPKKTIAK
jgi:hypothetical protein